MEPTAFSCLIEFDEVEGPVVRWIEPDNGMSKELRKRCNDELAFLCLAENASSISESRSDSSDHAGTTWIRVHVSDNDCVFGASAMVSERAKHQRGRQLAVAVLSRFPAFDALEIRARALSVVALESASMNARSTARQVAFSAAARCRCPSFDGDYAAAIPCERFVLQHAEITVRLIRSIITGSSLVCFSSKSSSASRAVVALASVLPALISLGWSTYVNVSTAPLLGKHDFNWRRAGFPLATGTHWLPAVSMAQLDDLLLFKGPLVLGTCNSMLARRLADAPQTQAIILDLDALDAPDSGNSISLPQNNKDVYNWPLDTHSKKLVTTLLEFSSKLSTRSEKQHDNNNGWLGSSSWVQRQFKHWLIAEMRTAAQGPKNGSMSLERLVLRSAKTDRKWFSRLAETEAFRRITNTTEECLSDDDETTVNYEISKYEGGFDENNLRDGQGILRTEDGRYEGEFVAGNRCGQGIWLSSDGRRKYQGPWAYDKEHGSNGCLEIEDDRGRMWQCKGEFQYGNCHGVGEIILLNNKNKWRYRGELFEGLPDGAGSLDCDAHVCGLRGPFFETEESVWPKFLQHTGEWRRGRRHGVGHSVFLREEDFFFDPNESSKKKNKTLTAIQAEWILASGEWQQDKLIEGVVRRGDGSERQGSFVETVKLQGLGQLTTAEGDQFDGVFIAGEMDDDASSWTVRFSDGTRYAGQLSSGVPSGKGICRYANGDCYQGDFCCGLRDGDGTLVRADGETLTGKWRCDNFVRGENNESNAQNGNFYSAMLFDDEDDDDEVHDEDFIELNKKDDGQDEKYFDAEYEDGSSSLAEATQLLTTRVSEQQKKNAKNVIFIDENNAKSSANLVEPSTMPQADECTSAPRNGTARVRYPNGDIYEGAFINGLRHGRGIFTEALTGSWYDGFWEKGRRHGTGTFVTGDKSFIFDGTWRHGRRVKGLAVVKGRCSYSGEWKNSLFHGQGKLIDSAKNTYIGEFQQGRKSGIGKQTYFDSGAIYTGSWLNGERNGHGTCVYTNLKTYCGEWKDDKWHGHGQLLEGDDGRIIFDGVFQKSKRHGFGVQTDEDGTTREGYWNQDQPDESKEWTLTFPDGSVYVGLLKHGQPHADAAVLKRPDTGELYQGAFEHGKKSGKGYAIFSSGECYLGDFKNDHISLSGSGVLTLPDGTNIEFHGGAPVHSSSSVTEDNNNNVKEKSERYPLNHQSSMERLDCLRSMSSASFSSPSSPPTRVQTDHEDEGF